MKHKMLLLTAMVLGSLASQTVIAQTTQPMTRAEVKGDAQGARVNGETRAPDLERNPSASKVKPRPTGDNQPETRMEVKDEAKRARAAGEITTGETPVPPSEKAHRSTSTKSRAEVKAGVGTPKERANVKSEYDPKDDPKVPKK